MRKKIRCGGEPMTAIVLAGGRGLRMNADKAQLDVRGRTLLEHVIVQIEPCFEEILVSISPRQKIAPPAALRRLAGGPEGPGVRGGRSNLRVIEDETPDMGPIGGILAGLRAAANEACVVVACDIPDVNVPLLRSLARAAAGAEIAVPVGPAGHFEPLFAVYRKSAAPEIEKLLRAGERSVLPLFGRCRTTILRLKDAAWLRNLNTPADYESYLRTISDQRPGRPKRP